MVSHSTTPTNSDLFSSIPPELLDRILLFTDPETISAFSQVAHTYHTYIESNTYLWRSFFSKYFDDDGQQACLDWKSLLQQRLRAQHIANAVTATAEDTESAIGTLIHVVETIPLAGASPSKNLVWLEEHIPTEFIYHIDTEDQPSQRCAKLRVLMCHWHECATSRLASRSYSYDMRNYKRSTQFGPFLPRRNGAELKINYVHLWHLMNVQFNNMCLEHGLMMKNGLWTTRPMTAPPSSVEGDWAGVEGEWSRFVSWMDYRDLEEYNWDKEVIPPKGESLDNSIFKAPGFTEAHLYMHVTMRVVSIEPQQPGSPLRPKIHYEGTSVGGDVHETVVKGTVSDEGNDVIRWHLRSYVGNSVRWQTEGTQLGGVQSAAGWIGCWSSPQHDLWDPAGPNWTFKQK